MSAEEFVGWQAFELIEGPLGARRADAQAAIVAATVANSVPRKGKAAVPDDYIPDWDCAPRRPISDDAITKQLRALTRAFPGG